MDIEREWRARPPTHDVTQLKGLVDDFIARFPRARRDTVVTYCFEASSLEQAIERAVRSKNAEGKHHNHQSKIRKEHYQPFIDALMNVRRELKAAIGFDAVFDIVNANKPHGWGEVGVYDVAVRIAAYFRCEPETVYLHAGVRLGCKAAGMRGAATALRFSKAEFPECMRAMTADEIEDFICTYRNVLQKHAVEFQR